MDGELFTFDTVAGLVVYACTFDLGVVRCRDNLDIVWQLEGVELF